MLIKRFQRSERLACVLVGLSRTAWRYQPLIQNPVAHFFITKTVRIPLFFRSMAGINRFLDYSTCERGIKMSLMCKMGEQCSATKGMCVHEKMMMGVVAVMALGGVAHWALHWFAAESPPR
jgi:hypothetical protein